MKRSTQYKVNTEHQTSDNKPLISPAEKFWYTWLQVVATITIVIGTLMAVFNHTDLFRVVNEKLEVIYFTETIITAEIESMQYWLVSLIGAILAAWGILVYYLITIPLKQKQVWAWNAIVISLIIWFVFDTWASFKWGAEFNLLMNLIFGFQYAAPLLFLRNSMKKSELIRIESDEY